MIDILQQSPAAVKACKSISIYKLCNLFSTCSGDEVLNNMTKPQRQLERKVSRQLDCMVCCAVLYCGVLYCVAW